MGKKCDATAAVLVVDDDPTLRRLICRVVRKYYPGCRAKQASDGLEAKKKLIDLCPQLVILDICMPNMGGMELCRSIQEHPWLTHTRILAITGYSTPGIHEKIFSRGASEFLLKPFDLSELIASIGRLLA